MLRALILLVFINTLNSLESQALPLLGEKKACQENPGKSTPCNSELYKNDFLKSNPFYEDDVLRLQKESLQKVESLLQDQDFQSFIAELQNKLPDFTQSLKSNEGGKHHGELLVFVSFSMGEKALLTLAEEAKRHGATLVLRGFKDNSHKQTVLSLQKIITKTGQGFIVDPELYPLFSIQAVPTFVLTKPFEINASERTLTPLHDRLVGHVSLHYALESFVKEGDLKETAQVLFERGKSL